MVTTTEAENDCKDDESHAECAKLVNSVYSLQTFTHDKMIRLVIPGQLTVPLHVTLHQGLCNISCEGGHLEHCQTQQQQFLWNNTGSPFYFENCTPCNHYCVTATISGECCSICTETVFMECKSSEYFSTNSLHWSLFISALGIILVFVVLGVILINRSKSTEPERQRANKKSENSAIISLTPLVNNITVVCLYKEDELLSFQDNVNSLEVFMEDRGLNVVDMRDEVDAINTSWYSWVNSVLTNDNTKLIVIDSESLRSLCARDIVPVPLRPVDKVLRYISQCSLDNNVNVYCKVFLVSFQVRANDERQVIYFDIGRKYIFPTQGETLVRDLLASLDH